MAARPPSLKVRALQWLAQREHSRPELRTKLLRLLSQAEHAAQAAALAQPAAPTTRGAMHSAEDADPVADAGMDVGGEGRPVLRAVARSRRDRVLSGAAAVAGLGVGTPAGDTLPAAAMTDGPALTPEQTVDALLDWLEARGYLSAQRFVESRIHARQQRYGNARIRSELREHGVNLDAATLETLNATEYERARAVWARKYGTTAEDTAARLRQMRFLAGRGFSADVVRRVVRGSAGDDDSAPD